MRTELIIIAGPTASGKSKLAIILAKKICAEIVSADSRQIYKFMDIGTAKPSHEELSLVPHHMIDIITPDKLYSAGEYKNNAEKIIDEILKKDKKVILVGGTGLYIKSITEGIFLSPARNDNKRDAYEKIIKEKGLSFLYEELKKCDPIAAKKIHVNDSVRIIRALEVYEETGMPISEFQTMHTQQSKYSFKMFGLKSNKEELYNRINSRVDKMFTEGFLNEFNSLIEKGYNDKSPGLQGIGYKELLDYSSGKYSLDEAIDHIKRNTRRYAKRQLTWFNHIPDISWFEANENANYDKIADEIIYSS
ncbi:tRNA (adenosine(37)-N6)-dimethylallyltransferase MiaA [Candidatus Poribacteria bacterium]|nr:tRNA (adenosine(37)-N6)-dimethylallyltransferase MiaA [Candidatus Poribacteria bacterium]